VKLFGQRISSPLIDNKYNIGGEEYGNEK